MNLPTISLNPPTTEKPGAPVGDKPAAVANETAVQLMVVVLVSAAIYMLALLRPYSLFQWASDPQLSIVKITHGDNRAAISYLLSFAVLFGLYWIASRSVLGRSERSLWAIVIGGAFVMSATLLFLYPTDALDIFDYIVRGRMQVWYGGNPFYQPPSMYMGDPFYPYAGWNNVTTAYGPGWELIAAYVAGLAGDGVIANVIAFKLVELVAYAGTMILIAQMLRRYAPERALYGVLLFAWNPLVIYVVAGNGHNDMLMVFFVVLGFYLLARGNYTFSAVALTAGALVKFIPALLFPLILLAGWQRMKTWGQRISFLMMTGGACLFLTALVFMPYWHGGDMLGTHWRQMMYTTSLPTWMVLLLQRNSIRGSFADLIVSRGAVILTAAWLGRELLRLWRLDRGEITLSWVGYVRAGLSILLFYLLVTCLWFQPWYVIWGVALASLLPEDGLTRSTIFFSMMSNWKVLIFDFLIVHRGPLPPLQVREWPLTTLTLGPTWAYLIYQSKRVQALPRRLVDPLRGGRSSRLSVKKEEDY